MLIDPFVHRRFERRPQVVAGKKLIERLGGELIEGAATVDLPELNGAARLRAAGLPLFTRVDLERR